MRVGTDVSEGSVSDIKDAIPQTPLPTIEDKPISSGDDLDVLGPLVKVKKLDLKV